MLMDGRERLESFESCVKHDPVGIVKEDIFSDEGYNPNPVKYQRKSGNIS